MLELDGQDFRVPAGIEREPVIGNHKGPLLLLAEMLDPVTGTVCMPRSLAASRRPWPAMISSLPSINSGLLKPNSSIEEAICWICLRECTLALVCRGRNAL